MGDVGLQVVVTQGLADAASQSDMNPWIAGGVLLVMGLIMAVLFIREMNEQ